MTSRWIPLAGGPIDVLMDVEPRNARDHGFPGRFLDRSPVLGPMLARAMAEGKPVASDPLPLLHPDGADGNGPCRAGFAGRRAPRPRASCRFPTNWGR